MIDSELQRIAAQQTASERISVPDADRVVIADTIEPEPAPDLQMLLQIRQELGDEGLTADEYAFLQAHQANAVTGDDHYANLAEALDEHELNKIAQNVLNWVEWDEESRKDWYEQEKKGIRALGVSPYVDGGAPFDGASTVVHPLFAEAIVQFSARTLEILWPAGGPVKAAVLGKITEERDAQAKRVEQFMNYQYTQQMEGAFEQTDRLLARLPLSGSCFVKAYHDPVCGIVREFVEPADFIVPYRAESLRTAPRYTERILKSQNEVRKLQVAGLYRDIDLIPPQEESSEAERHIVTDEIRATEGRDESDRSNDDQRHTLLECYCDLDIPGFEDQSDGRPTGIALPYIVTVDRDSQKVLSIYRNWKKTDPQKRRIVYHIHYRFMPGLGFYGYGLYHWIGGLTNAATGALRALLDSAQFANMPGGFRAKDAALPNGKLKIAPGDWPEVDCDADDLKKAFFPLPYKEPSSVLFNLLGLLQELGRRFAGTTEVMVGEGGQNVPVGTMLARIEQGGRVQTSIQKRLLETQAQELKLVAWLNSVWLPDEYPYAVQGEDRAALRADFDDRIDVVPVSDPSFVSNVQRYFMSELVIELAGKFPGLYDPYEVNKRALQSIRMDDIDALLPPKDKNTQRFDPVTENALLMVGRPVRAFMEQAHEAHVAVHQMAMQQMQQGDPAMAAIEAHIREHLAMAHLTQMGQMLGIPLAMPEEGQPEMPIEMETQLAVAAAQAAQQLAQPQQPDPETVKAQAEIERKNAVAEADIRRKDEVAAADIRRKDVVAAATVREPEATPGTW